ncbi:MAG: M12 family metallopeptidase, partial [Chitinophagaceae bacterium]
MPLKSVFSLLAFLLLIACNKKLEQPTTVKELTAPPSLTAFKLPPGGSTSIIDFENGRRLETYKKDTSYYVEGDIILVPAQIEQLKKINSLNTRSVINSYVNQWKDGVVPYVINGAFSMNDRNTILNAVYNWETNTTINLVERTPENAAKYPDFVEIVPAWGNAANIGKIGGHQYIQLLVDPVYGVHLTSVTHEIGHVLGFFHEQSRADRNNFITINWSNIQPSAQHNFLTWDQQGLQGLD